MTGSSCTVLPKRLSERHIILPMPFTVPALVRTQDGVNRSRLHVPEGIVQSGRHSGFCESPRESTVVVACWARMSARLAALLGFPETTTVSESMQFAAQNPQMEGGGDSNLLQPSNRGLQTLLRRQLLTCCCCFLNPDGTGCLDHDCDEMGPWE